MIFLDLEQRMKDKKITSNELADRVGISYVNISRIKCKKINSIRFSTLEGLCDVLDCEPGDLIKRQ